MGLQRGYADAQVLLGRSRCRGPDNRAKGRAAHEAFTPGAARGTLEKSGTRQCPGKTAVDRPSLPRFRRLLGIVSKGSRAGWRLCRLAHERAPPRARNAAAQTAAPKW